MENGRPPPDSGTATLTGGTATHDGSAPALVVPHQRGDGSPAKRSWLRRAFRRIALVAGVILAGLALGLIVGMLSGKL